MHSSRMHTARFSGRIYREQCLPLGPAEGVVSASWSKGGGCLPLGPRTGSGKRGVCLWVQGCLPHHLSPQPPVNGMNHRQVQKHYLPATSFAGSKMICIFGVVGDMQVLGFRKWWFVSEKKAFSSWISQISMSPHPIHQYSYKHEHRPCL